MKKAIVIGAGFAGLSSALSLAICGHDVTILDKRVEYSRVQMIFVSPELIRLFYIISSLPSIGITIENTSLSIKLVYSKNFKEPKDKDLDLNFFRLLESHECVISINDFQNYQLAKLKQIIKEEQIQLGNITFLTGANYKVTEIDTEEQILKLPNNETMSFDNLVVADGAKSEVAALIKQQNPNIANLMSKNLLPQPKHNAYGYAKFKIDLPNKEFESISDKVITPHNGKKYLELSSYNHLLDLGWDEEFLPFIYIKIDPKTKEIYITGEIPKEFVKIKDSVEKFPLIKYFSFIISVLTNIDENKLCNSSCSTFLVTPQHYERNYIKIGKEGGLFIVGDAFLPANFLFGHGAESAIADGNSLVVAFDKNGNLSNPEHLFSNQQSRLLQYKDYNDGIESCRIYSDNSPYCKTDHPLFQNRQNLTWMTEMVNQQRMKEWEARHQDEPNSFAIVPYQKLR